MHNNTFLAAMVMALVSGTSMSKAQAMPVYMTGFDTPAALDGWNTDGFEADKWVVRNGTLLHTSSDNESDPAAITYQASVVVNSARRFSVEVDAKMILSANDRNGHAAIVFGHRPGQQANVFSLIADTSVFAFYDYNHVGFTRDGTPDLHVLTVPGFPQTLDQWYHVGLTVDLDAATVAWEVSNESGLISSDLIDATTLPSFADLQLNGTGHIGLLSFTRSVAQFDNFVISVPDPEANPVPEPSTLLLSTSVLLGFLGYRWQHSRQAFKS